MPIYLAYDGSVNGDWIAHYAVNFAAYRPQRCLQVLHVETTNISGSALAAKFDYIKQIAEHAGVNAKIEICPMRHGAFGGLIDRLPKGRDTKVICGVRAQGGRRGVLAGTVSEQLLNDQKFNVVAIRVVQPGLLGVARRLLMPMAGHRPGVQSARTLLELVAPSLTELRLLHVIELSKRKLHALDATKAGALRYQAQAYLEKVERDLTGGIDLDGVHIDSDARISDDWSREILIDAGHARADMLALEAPRTSLLDRFRYSDPLEVILRDTPCDVAIYRGLP